jgi:hypothetical protein
VRIPLGVGINLIGNSKSFIGLGAFGGASAFFITGTGDQDKDLFNTASWDCSLERALTFPLYSWNFNMNGP